MPARAKSAEALTESLKAMTRFKPDHEIVLAGFGYADDGPHLVLNDIDEAKRYVFPVLGRTFSLRRLQKRYCTGPFDLKTLEARCCPNKVELLPDMKETQCPACIEETGFNPSFYFATTISPQQRAYNLTPHFVYMAYFAPGFVKVGISSETRGVERLLEQGARAACVIGRFENADAARELEARLCAEEDIYETMRASKKRDLLVEVPYRFEEGASALRATAEAHDVAILEGPFDLSPYYFGGPSPSVDEMTLPQDDADGVCAGRCVGMVGADLVFRQKEMNFVTLVKEWESHVVELYVNEVVHEYAYEPAQMMLL